MKLYYWSSERFEDYLEGSIIVMAKNIKEARAKALSHYNKEWGSYGLDKLKKDLQKEPYKSEDVIFIYGSS